MKSSCYPWILITHTVQRVTHHTAIMHTGIFFKRWNIHCIFQPTTENYLRAWEARSCDWGSWHHGICRPVSCLISMEITEASLYTDTLPIGHVFSRILTWYSAFSPITSQYWLNRYPAPSHMVSTVEGLWTFSYWQGRLLRWLFVLRLKTMLSMLQSCDFCQYILQQCESTERNVCLNWV